MRHARESLTRNLPQFLSTGDAVAIHRNSFGRLRTLKYEYHDRFSDIRSEKPSRLWTPREALIDEVWRRPAQTSAIPGSVDAL